MKRLQGTFLQVHLIWTECSLVNYENPHNRTLLLEVKTKTLLIRNDLFFPRHLICGSLHAASRGSWGEGGGALFPIKLEV